MSQQISLYIDVQNRQLVRSNSSTIPTSLPDVFQGDTLGLYLEFLDATGGTANPYTDIDFSSAAVSVGVGTIGAQPTSGFFTITDTAATQTTANIAYNASPAAVQSAIQAALTTNWSAATVTGGNGGPYVITNGVNGAKTALVGTSVSLTPSSFVEISTQQTGTSGLPEILYMRVLQSPIALQTTWTPYPSPTAVVSRLQTGSGTVNEIQQITLGNNPYSGAFVVNFGGQTSNPIQWNASPAAVQTALQAMSSIGSGNVTVGGSAGAWVITFTGTKALASQTLMTTVATGLVGPLALTGTLSLNTAAIEEAIGEGSSTTQTFEIKVTPAGSSAFTCLQETITIYNDLIVGAPSVPTPGVSYFTEAESDARYFQITNNLSEGTAATIRTNLGLTGVFLQKSNNLSDVASASTARTNLGLGTAATHASTDFVATSAIGTSVQAHSSTLDTLAASNPITAGTGIAFSGTWPAVTIASTGGGGTVSALGTNFSTIAGISSGTLELSNAVNAFEGLATWDSAGNLVSPQTTGGYGYGLNIYDSSGGFGNGFTINNGVIGIESQDETLQINVSSSSTYLNCGADRWIFPPSVGEVTLATSLQVPTSLLTGTFALSSGTATISNSGVTANSVIVCTVKSSSGTRAGVPDCVPTAGTGFTATGGGSDNSTYNYIIFN